MLLILLGNFVEKFYKRFFLDPNQPTIIFCSVMLNELPGNTIRAQFDMILYLCFFLLNILYIVHLFLNLQFSSSMDALS